ncbi:MAG: NUDIX domain-containing protein [Ginsengibacter sp.]
MARNQSAGLLLYRKMLMLEVFLVHPGGPLWRNKDATAWSIPKGEFDESEEPLQAAIREFSEETGITVSGKFIEMTPVVQKGGKKVFAWALEINIDVATVKSNHFEMQWPPRSGKFQSFPEIDRGEWFTVDIAMKKINVMQGALIKELQDKLTP